MNASKQIVLAAVESAELRLALASIPGAYFQVAHETASDPEDLYVVLWRLVDLYRAATAQMRRRTEALEAELADARRHGLHLAADPSSAPSPTQERDHELSR